MTLLALPLIAWVVARLWWFALTALALSFIYLGAQRAESHDHLLIQQRWPSFWDFLAGPPRR